MILDKLIPFHLVIIATPFKKKENYFLKKKTVYLLHNILVDILCHFKVLNNTVL